MVQLIIGTRGAGKTKKLISAVHEAYESSTGNVVCVEKGKTLTRQIKPQVRLISADEFGVTGYDAFYGFLSGICASDYDVTHIFVDATLRIGSRDYNELAAFLKKVKTTLCEAEGKRFTFTVSADKGDLPAEVFDFCSEAA
ncbi:MAG: hypothetical protein LBR73_04550 [Oscillospiraceae bacterium]|jgi:hypothetical protein|nr:hypothetical protein [Oscillospiraceae bacterium]